MANNVRAPFLFAPSLPPPLSPSATPPPPPSPPLTPTLDTSDDLDEYPQEPQNQPQPTMVALGKRPMGGLPDSKNKPKPTLNIFKPIVLIVPVGMNIINAIIDFSHKKDASIAVHHASGAISEVNIFNPLSSNCWYFQGNLHMIYLSGFYTKSISPYPLENSPCSPFNIQFSIDWPYQVFGGLVGRKLIAAEPVHVFASIIKNPEYQEVVNPTRNPNVQPVMMRTHETHSVANALIGNTNNNVNHPDFSNGASTSSTSMNIQPSDALPRDVNMLYWNDPTN